MKESLTNVCAKNGMNVVVEEGAYNQYAQEIVYGFSPLYDFNPDLLFLIVDSREALKNYFYTPYCLSEPDRKVIIKKYFDEQSCLINKFLETQQQGKIIVFNLSVPYYSPYGIIEEKTSFSLKDMVLEFNAETKKRYFGNDRVYIFDFDGFVKKHGEQNIFDYRKYFYGGMHIELSFYPHLCEELMAFIYPSLSMSKKCIVLDLDDTLWGGIVGEDGVDGISLGPTPPGNAYIEFQRHLLALSQRGILLAINSKNNPEDALKAIREHPHMILKEEHFVAMKINWADKSQNMIELSKELNLGLDSFVFFDNDPANRQLIREGFPQILVVDMPEDAAYFTRSLMELTCFNTYQITDEDLHRGEMYSQERKRKETAASFSDIDSFLKSLDIKIEIKEIDESMIPRISQLTMKTNQFNMTTKRYSEDDIKKILDKYHIIYGITVSDKYGTYGVSGAVIINKNEDALLLDTFLLSCRILGKGIEKAVLKHVIETAKNNNIKNVIGFYRYSGKNNVCHSVYAENGFKEISDGIYEYDTSIPFQKIDYIEVN